MNAGMPTETPRVDTLIKKVMARHPSITERASAAFYEHALQELAPLARELERELVRMQQQQAASLHPMFRDARRYRKLRNQNIESQQFPRPGVFIGRTMPDSVLTHEDADRAVDSMPEVCA